MVSQVLRALQEENEIRRIWGGLPSDETPAPPTNPGVHEIRRISVVNLDTWQERSPPTWVARFLSVLDSSVVDLLVAAGEGAILAGQAEPHRECSMAVSGDSVAWWTRIPPFGRGFSRHRGLPIRWVFWRAQRHAPPRSGHRLDEPARLSLGNGCIPAVPASVSPGEIIVTPARGQQTLRPAPRCSRLGLPRLRRKLRTPRKRAPAKIRSVR